MLTEERLYGLKQMIESIFNQVDAINKEESYLNQFGLTANTNKLEDKDFVHFNNINAQLRTDFKHYAILMSYGAENFFHKMGLSENLEKQAFEYFVLQFLQMKYYLYDQQEYHNKLNRPNGLDEDDLTYSEYGTFNYKFYNIIQNEEDKWGEKYCYVRKDVPSIFLLYELIHENVHAMFCPQRQNNEDNIVIPMGLKEMVYDKTTKKVTSNTLPVVFDEAITNYIAEGILLEILSLPTNKVAKMDSNIGRKLKQIQDPKYYDSLGNCLIVPVEMIKILLSNQQIKQAIIEFLLIHHDHEKLHQSFGETLLPLNAFEYLSSLFEQCYDIEKQKLENNIDIQDEKQYTLKEQAILKYLEGVIGIYNAEEDDELLTYKTK